ncbi:GNAT family N-acetyltransferase [Azospirillum picis]|uniref:Phosphinothricin acetyltransferase n=1 Tax=Azospirillum picis TaxID=488438 RepID=A0ABU0MT82_9PROT|nr:GNAT family N-acetyltransferase [Azospirillum picis]MBP2302946.1 phosphinothricin acetyltransferase [Azospirillum picis]MDQ0536698.1 phosphinothricin acetyltransferase [Azospirillum picis]
MSAITIRPSADADIPAITTLYAHHVLTGTASFEEVPPDEAEMARRRGEILARGLPYLVAECEGRLGGYAYAGLYRTRSAYRFTLENSVYVAAGLHRRGIGRALMDPLIEACEGSGHRRMIAAIGDSANQGSIALHAACGFRPVGVLPAVGFKFGRWLDSVLMERPLGPGSDEAPVERR